MGGTTDIDVEKLELQPFVKRSVTTLAGNVPGTTLVDATLVEAANFWNGCWVLIRTGTYAGELRRVTGFASPTITLDHTVGGQIVAGVQYVMMPMEPGRDPAFPLYVLDPGTNTNPRRYEKLYGFVSARVAVAGGPARAALWNVGTAAINPATGRTAGRVTTVYTLELENPTGNPVTAWLEDQAGVVLSQIYNIAANDTVIIDWVAGKNFGNRNLWINGSVAGILAQVCGTEE